LTTATGEDSRSDIVSNRPARGVRPSAAKYDASAMRMFAWRRSLSLCGAGSVSISTARAFDPPTPGWHVHDPGLTDAGNRRERFDHALEKIALQRRSGVPVARQSQARMKQSAVSKPAVDLRLRARAFHQDAVPQSSTSARAISAATSTR
jgi:hypothetical protein